MQINSQQTAFVKCSAVEIPDSFYNRMSTGCKEIDLMFGTEYFPGFMPGYAITITGVGGSGKSTFLCQVAQMLYDNGKKSAIASGEESHQQLAFACKRLGLSDVDIAHVSNVEDIADAMDYYDFMVVDSFQALRSSDKNMKKRQFSEYAQDLLLNKAKETGCVLVFVLHITTAGLPKGGTDIIHAVDVNMRVLIDPNDESIRIFDIYKNRAGETKKHSAIMGAKGFDFQGLYVEPEPETKSGRGKPVNEERKEKVLAMNEPPHITLDRVMQDLGVGGQTAGIILRELVGEKKLAKFGRGANACWKLIGDCKEIYESYKELVK